MAHGVYHSKALRRKQALTLTRHSTWARFLCCLSIYAYKISVVYGLKLVYCTRIMDV